MKNYCAQKISHIYIIAVLLIMASNSFAQNTVCNINGRVIDSVSGKPIEYAAVSVFLKGQTNVAGGMITDEKGLFVIENIAAGTYKLKIDFVGYKTKVKEDITIKPGANNLSDIPISDKSSKMKEVTVVGTKSFVENKIDKFVFNVGNDVTSAGGTATDVLKKVPQVSVDIDGNVELLGNTNIKVLLNGKPSSQFDNNLAEALRVIPASQIEKIEVITSPGAQYDAEGTGGIINIILKESKTRGINGNVNLSAGSRIESGSMYLHIQRNKVGVNLSLGSNLSIPGTTPSSMVRNSDSAGIPASYLSQKGQGTAQWGGYRGQLGMDWDINKKEHLSVSADYFYHQNSYDGSTFQDQTIYLPTFSDVATKRNAANSEGFGYYDLSVSYKKEFKKEGQEISFYFKPGYTISNSNFQQTQQFQSNDSLFSGAKGDNKLKEYETFLTADYTHPFTNDIVLNVGTKGIFTRVNSLSEHEGLLTTTRQYLLDPTFINNFDYSRDVYSAYVSMSFPLGKKFSFKAGLRDELTIFHKVNMSDSTIPSYSTVVPSIVISRSFLKKQTLKISYAYRIQRPGWWNLNPYIDATDPLNISQGNPTLKPELGQNIDLTYIRNFEKGSSIILMLYGRYTMDDEQSYVIYKSVLPVSDSLLRNVAINTSVNAGNQYLSGFSLSGTLKALDEKLEIRGNFNVFYKYIVSNLVAGATASGINYRTNINVTYNFTKTLVAECYGNFRSQRTEIQGKFPTFSSYSIAIKKLFWNRNGSLAFTTTNPFTPYVDQATKIAGQNFTMVSDRKVPYQSFGLSFTYKFGKMEFKDNGQSDQDMGGKEGMN